MIYFIIARVVDKMGDNENNEKFFELLNRCLVVGRN